MINISYNLSSVLKNNLHKADTLRREILLTPISSKFEIQLRWDCVINRIFQTLRLSDNSLKKTGIIKILDLHSGVAQIEKKNQTAEQKEVINYKKALDHISAHWLVTKKLVILNDILILYDIFSKGRLVAPRSEIEELLNYVQIQDEHPIIQAGIANIEIQKIRPFSNDNDKLSRLLSYIFLYKYGYDVRGLIEFEEPWSENKAAYLDAVEYGIQAASVTIWLEFFSNSIILQLDEVYKKIISGSPDFFVKENSLWELNDRQKAILNLLDKPDSSITNKKVQKHFKISQITASRDLSKLTTLGLLLSHGKGRSVYYIRA
ncbi:MAG: DeoR family transcriptional regulator [Patescibacteria group bacterium]